MSVKIIIIATTIIHDTKCGSAIFCLRWVRLVRVREREKRKWRHRVALKLADSNLLSPCSLACFVLLQCWKLGNEVQAFRSILPFLAPIIACCQVALPMIHTLRTNDRSIENPEYTMLRNPHYITQPLAIVFSLCRHDAKRIFFAIRALLLKKENESN